MGSLKSNSLFFIFFEILLNFMFGESFCIQCSNLNLCIDCHICDIILSHPFFMNRTNGEFETVVFSKI